ncbi:MAG: RagB/SusD family nutrient uptake outer membrane protein [Bacteroidetes bacterium]|nr:MAG: RagB/SusD family nutrient uptake outer membrane protein [Bacteroidota bacterium]
MKSTLYLLLIFILLTLVSCKKYLELESPNNLTTDNFYKTEKDAFEAAMAMYSNIQHLRYYGAGYFKLTEYPSDDITGKVLNVWDEFSWSAIKSGAYEDNDNFFGHLYEGIFRTNLVLEKVSLNRVDGKEVIPFTNEVDRNNILAEAYFLRGLNYFNGACFYGGLPILTETPKESKLGGILYTKRSTRLQTFERAIEDLKTAIGEGSNPNIKLPESWKSDFAGRATIYAGYALLGKIYLHAACYFQNQDFFTQSEKYLGLVINSAKYELLPKYADVFSSTNKNNKESVFEIGYGLVGTLGFFHDGGIAGENTQRDLFFGVQKGIGSGYGELIATQNWVLESEYGDPRVREFLHFAWDTIPFPDSQNKRVLPIDAVSGKVKANYTVDLAKTVKEVGENEAGSYFHVKKAVDGYEAGGPGGLNGVNNWRLIRYADVLLMYAEALNELGRSSQAISFINKIRQRAANSVPVVNGVKVFRSAKIIRTSRSSVSVGEYTGLYEETTITGGKHEVDPTKDILADYPTLYGIYNGEPVDLTTISKESVRLMIVRERRAELAFEYLRFLDMRRWEALDKIHPGAASTVFESKNIGNSLPGGNDKQPYNSAIHNLYPIPQQQIDLSQGTMVQNPGY